MKFYTNVYYNYDSMLVAERNSNGKKEYLKEAYTPSVFVPSNKPSSFKTIEGKSVTKMTFENYQDYKEFIDNYTDVPNFEIHGDIQFEYQFINQKYGTDIKYDMSQIDVMYIDIETTSENGWPSVDNPQEKVIAITVISTLHGCATFCLGTYNTTADVKVFEFQDEETLLKEFVDYFSKNYPDIVSGWNIRFFDFPYLINRIKAVLGSKVAKNLSPWGILKERKVTRKDDKEEIVYDMIGISMLDYFEVYKTFTYVNQESYSLNNISYVELGERKISYSEFESLTDFYKKDFQKFIEYNIRDVELVQKLENKLKLIELVVALSYSAGVNYQDVFSQVRTWDVIIYNYLSKNNIVIPPKKRGKKNEQYAGAYVKEPILGKHPWVVSFDLNSLYPHLIMQYGISPECVVTESQVRNRIEELKRKLNS